MAQTYFSLVTTTGKIKLAQSAAGGAPVVITHFAVGDGNGAETNPTAASVALVREVWRTPVESVVTDPENPSAVLVTAIIPTAAGGWWMREFGVFDAAGSMVAVAKPVSQYKPTALEGQLEDIRYEFQIIIGESANVTLLVDPSLLFATRSWVENRKIPMSQMMRLPWLAVMSMTATAPPVAPAQGDTYLVPAGATGAWAANVSKIAEWTGSAWSYVSPLDGHGISLPDGRVFERVGGSYVEKIALDAQSGKWCYAVAAGAANAITATLAPAPSALVSGMGLTLKLTATNTAAATLNVNGLGAKSIVTSNGASVRPGDLVPGVIDLVYDGTAWTIVSMLPRFFALPSGKNILFITETQNWTVPSGVTSVKARVVGGGGGGGGGNVAPQIRGGGGGSGGGYAEKLCSVVPGAVIACTIGAGGIGGVPGNVTPGTNAGAGGTTSFGAFCSATGGSGGSNTGTSISTGGNGVGGDLNFPGSGGQQGIEADGARYGAPGGSAPLVGGSSSSSAGVGYNAVGYGAAGGGAANSGQTGGNGAAGVIILEW